MNRADLEAIFLFDPEPTVVLDDGLAVVVVNEAFARLWRCEGEGAEADGFETSGGGPGFVAALPWRDALEGVLATGKPTQLPAIRIASTACDRCWSGTAHAIGAVEFVVLRLVAAHSLPHAEPGALRSSEAELRKFKSISDNASVAFLLIDRDGLIVYANRHACLERGYPEGGLVGRHVSLLNRMSMPQVAALIELASREGKALFETFHARSDGSTFPVEVQTTYLELENGPHLFSAIRDITDRHDSRTRMERLLREVDAQRERLAQVFQLAPAFMCILRGKDHVFELCNERYKDLIGGREVIGLPVREALPEVAGQGYFELLDQVFTTGEPFVGTGMRALLARSDGGLDERFIDFVYQPAREASGEISGILVHGVDLTDRFRAESALRDSEGRHRFLLHLNDLLKDLTDPAAIQVQAAHALREHLGAYRVGYVEDDGHEQAGIIRLVSARSGPDLTGVHPYENYGAAYVPIVKSGRTIVLDRVEDDPLLTDAEKRSFQALSVAAVVYVPLVKGGRLVALVFVSRAEPHAWSPDEVALIEAFAGRTWDALERARAEAALRENEQRYRDLFNSMDEGFCVIEIVEDTSGHPVDYRFVEVNPAYEQHTGLKDATGRRARDLVPDLEDHWIKAYGLVARTGEPMRFINEAKSMEGRWFDVYAFRIGPSELRQVAILFNEITERKRLEWSLRDRVNELAEADRRKNEFLAMLAHELRNPLAGIHNAIRVARLPGSGEHLDFAHGVIERQAQNLRNLIDDLLDISRIIQGKVELRREVVDCPIVLGRAVEAVRSLIEQRGHTFQTSIPPGTLPVNADPTRLEQIVANLLTNAAKYTEEGGVITLSAHSESGDAVISVQDNGIGIAPEMLTCVFDLFTQVERTAARTEGGLGIGLTLVKQLVELHGGQIDAISTLGVGSVFTVRLPLAAPLPEASPPSLDPVTGRGRVLVVDDNLDAAALTGWLLRSKGFEVEIVHDGPAALEATHRLRPLAVILDIGLPGMDGYEVARRLRAVADDPSPLIVGLSGYGDAFARDRANQAGFDHYLVKPVDIEAIISVIPSGSPGS